MNKVVHIDNLVEECGYFTSRTTVNSGYGCRHPKQRDVEKEHMESLKAMGVDGSTTCGRCFAPACPLGDRLSPSEGEKWLMVEVDKNGRVVGAAPEKA